MLRILKELTSRKIPIVDSPDVIRWGYTNRGTFSIKEAFHIQQNEEGCQSEEKWKKIWYNNFWPKIASFCWLLVRHRILTWDNLLKRGMQGPSCCVFCLSALETPDHLLEACWFASELWAKGEQRFRRWARVGGNVSETIANWPSKNFKNAILNRMWELFPGILVWELWKERNGRIFDGKSRPLDKVWLNIEKHLKETLSLTPWTAEDFKAEAQERLTLNEWGITSIPTYQGVIHAHPVSRKSPDCWSPPETGSFMLNFDGAAKGNPGPAGFGGAVRNHEGQMLGIFWGDLGYSSNNLAELEGRSKMGYGHRMVPIDCGRRFESYHFHGNQTPGGFIHF